MLVRIRSCTGPCAHDAQLMGPRAHLEDAADQRQPVHGVQQAGCRPQRHEARHAERDGRGLLVVVLPPLLQVTSPQECDLGGSAIVVYGKTTPWSHLRNQIAPRHGACTDATLQRRQRTDDALQRCVARHQTQRRTTAQRHGAAASVRKRTWMSSAYPCSLSDASSAASLAFRLASAPDVGVRLYCAFTSAPPFIGSFFAVCRQGCCELECRAAAGRHCVQCSRVQLQS